MTARTVAIVGAGASGTILALHLRRAGFPRVILVERAREPGRGIAYGSRRPEHLLNVPARRMSVWPDDPDEFARRWTELGGGAEGYAPRAAFGDYLAGRLEKERDGIEIVTGEAVDVATDGAGQVVRLADRRCVEAEVVVLAMGNFQPASLPGLDPVALGGALVEDPWYGALGKGLGADDLALLVGTGLTAVDAALTLAADGFDGRILALSRRGLSPRANLPREPVAEPLADFPIHAVALLRAVRHRAVAIGWREAIHEVRQVVQRIWSAAPQDERRRFIRHLRPWWDVHRHRIAPAVADGIDALQRGGRLRFAAGRLVAAEPDGQGGAIVTWRPRGSGRHEVLRAARIVNCSGPELDVERSEEPLLAALLESGRIRPDGCRQGIDVDPFSRVRDRDGAPSDRLYAIGPMTRGAFWESIAVSDIAAQAEAIALRIAGDERT